MRPGYDRGVIAGVILLAAMIVGIAASSYLNTRRLWTDADGAAHCRAVLDAAGGIRADARKLQSGQRVFLITGDETALQPYHEASASIHEEVGRLQALTADDPDLGQKAAEVAKKVATGLASMKEVIDLRREKGFFAVLQLAPTRGIRTFVDPLLDTLAELDQQERERLATLEAKTRLAYSRAVWYGGVTAVLGLLAVVMFVWLLHRSYRARARNLAELSEQRELLDATLTSIGDGVIATDGAGRVLFLNTVAEKLTGWAQAAARGRPLEVVFRIVTESTRTPVENPALRAMRNGTTVGLANRTILIAKDGTERPIDDSAAPIRSRGAVGGAVLVFRDITDRKRTELEQGRLANTLGLALSAADLGTWEWDPATDLITLSDRAAEIYRLTLGQTYTREWMRGLLHPDYRNQARAAAVRAVVERADYDMAYPLDQPGAKLIWVSARGRGVYGPDGKLTRMLGIVQDVTARKEAEQEREGFLNRLQEQDKRKDEFLATLAHELRNPLAPVRNGVQILRASTTTDPTTNRTLEMMERQLGQMVHLVDDLMDVSRVSSGKIVLRRERVELRAVIDSAIEATREAVEAAGHELTVQLLDEPLVVNADRTRLAQVMTNLLNNAIKYTPTAGRITLTAERNGTDAVIRVTDTGVGIPADMLPKVFDMFTQVGASLDRAQGGLGIGLTLVRRLVELHDGRVEAHSDGPGCGSQFTIHLPLSREADEMPAPPKSVTKPLKYNLRVLVVDDNKDAAESLAVLLELLGHTVARANDGATAVSVAVNRPPDVILLDLGMPGMNGYEVAARIRQCPELQGVTLVALTGWGSEDDRRRTKEAGFDHHLVKPADLMVLEKVMAGAAKSK